MTPPRSVMVDGSEVGRITVPAAGPVVADPAGAFAWLNTNPPLRWDLASGALTPVGESSLTGTALVAATGRSFRQRGPQAPVVWRDPGGRAGSLQADGAHHLESASPDGAWVSLRRDDGAVRLIVDAATGRTRVPVHTQARVAFTDVGPRAVAVHTSRGMIRSVALDTGATDDVPVVAPEGLRLVWAERGGTRAIALDGGGALSLCDLAARTVRPLRCAIPTPAYARDDDVAAGWGRALVWSNEGPVVVELDTGARRPAPWAARGATFLPGAAPRVAQVRGGMLEVVQLDDGRVERFHDGHGAPVRQLAWSRDGSLLASLASDRRVRVLDVAARALACEVELEGDGPWRVAFSADGRELLTVSAARPSSWDARTGAARATWPPLPTEASLLSVSPDGREFAVASGQSVTFVDLAALGAAATWRRDMAAAFSLSHGPDGTAYAVMRSPATGSSLFAFPAGRRDRAWAREVGPCLHDATVVGASVLHRAPARLVWKDLADDRDRAAPLEGVWRLARVIGASSRSAMMLRAGEARWVVADERDAASWRPARAPELAVFSPDDATVAVAYADGGVEVFAR
ncbi:MAG: hypothetical protein U0324_28590 [Polyangiales bacterium]